MNVIDKLTGKVTTEKLVKESEDILKTFTTTLTNLTGVNEDIDLLQQQREEERKKLEEEIYDLRNRKEKNSRVIEKINQFLE